MVVQLRVSDICVVFKGLEYFLDPKIPLGTKNQALSVLPFFLSFSEFESKVLHWFIIVMTLILADCCYQIEAGLKTMAANQFPQLSSEIDKASVV